ncbi:MAG: hypothetical protein V3V75_11110 [Thermoguttaceae bacterium]
MSKENSRRRKIIIASSVGAAVAILVLLASGPNESKPKVFKQKVFAEISVQTALLNT